MDRRTATAASRSWKRGDPAAPLRTNVALAANGGVASASSTYTPSQGAGYDANPGGANNGNRSGKVGANSTAWTDNTQNTWADWLQVDFNSHKTIDEIDVFSSQDAYMNPIEPTEAMTFSLYGLSGFDVQYWNGTSWVTVPGGSVTGNNKVWKKISFAPITTTKIRVLTNASPDGYSRITELEAWTASSGGSSATVRWLVADHLGTPRMVFDQSGSLANVSRHDYLPFGEELFANTGGRTTAQGYGGDNVRQKFTGYERDNEINLDFAEARYYGYNHGRFTSPDSFLSDTHKEDPASWNLYVYVRNNPLNYIDPSGEELRLVRVTDKQGKVTENIDGDNRKALLGWLNTTYGCNGCVTVDKNNVIRLNTSQVSKDVLAVTKDLTDAINDKNHIAFVVGYEGNADVNFAQAQQSIAALGGRDAILVDFKDFRGLSGDKEAVSAFTNYAFVHEVFHLFPSLLKDTTSDKDVTGPVENKVNEIRQVRGAMLRASYSASSDNGIFGSMWFGRAKVDNRTGAI